MKSADIMKWFEALASESEKQPAPNSSGMDESAARWVANAGSALSGTFPPGHELRKRWDAVGDLRRQWNAKVVQQAGKQASKAMIEGERLQNYRGIFAAAYDQLRDGRLDSFVDTVRAQTEDELLDQAKALTDVGFLVAATVLAGGALEVHLRQLCEKNQLKVQTPPSIDKYNTAIAVARNDGLTIYEKPDASLVTSWGQSRNEAAHKPDQFRASIEQVNFMIDGIRNFIARIR
jgi:hypothetical protein